MTEPAASLASALADRYRLERELGRGGMATVYLAQDLKHDRPVALKVLHPELAAALGPERFQREIRLAARLQHPHILSVHDSGESAGQLWFTMPFVEGESLRDRLSRERQLPVEDAVRIAREAALALQYAHRHGVIHRDIKPENLLLTADGSTLVGDFGIARALGGSEASLTSTGMAVGTPAYMSPEQASGSRSLDERTDIYALGCVLYEMLAGEPPFTGPTAQAIVARALTETPRPIHPSRSGVSAALDAVIAKAMAATPADRYGSAADLLAALDRVARPARESAGAPPLRAPIPRPFARRPLFTMLALGILIGAGALFAWRQSHSGAVESGIKRLAVLPFENLGADSDAYFADGVTDEVRGKLTALPGIQVTARGSSNVYRKSTKPLQEVGRELGVQYLLTGTVRWEKGPGNASRVHVSPELIEVTTGASKWQAPFDAALTDVFQVQADIAGRVAQALDVALGDSTRRQLSQRPTANLAAYSAYLKGQEISQDLGANDLPTLDLAIGQYEEAVALDSTFVQAWSKLARARALHYSNGVPDPAIAEQARRAAERARDLAPNAVDGHLALATYYRLVRQDYAHAREELALAQRASPNDPDVVTELGLVEQSLGRWDDAIGHLRQAQELDPRSINTARRLARALLYERRYPEAEQSVARALVISPTQLDALETRFMISLARGDLAGARAGFGSVPAEVDPTALVAYFATYFDLCWALDDARQRQLLTLPPSAFGGDRTVWAIVRAQVYALHGDQYHTRVYADSARLALEEQLRATPTDAQRHVFLGLALAYLGRKDEATREGLRAVRLLPVTGNAFLGAYVQHQLVRVYLLVGEPDKALEQLEPLLKVPYYLSPGWLKIDPTFDPVRQNPRFQRLVAGG